MTEQKRRRIDQIQDPAFLSDLATAGLDELRIRRSLCSGLDTELSYYRRLLHGRMDLLSFEAKRRSGEEQRTLVEALPEILAGEGGPVTPTAGTAIGRKVPIEAPELPQVGRRAVDRVLGDDFLARLPSLDDDEINRIQALLTEVESEISRQRRSVFEALDLVQAELTRRYREGLADADEMIRS